MSLLIVERKIRREGEGLRDEGMGEWWKGKKDRDMCSFFDVIKALCGMLSYISNF